VAGCLFLLGLKTEKVGEQRAPGCSTPTRDRVARIVESASSMVSDQGRSGSDHGSILYASQTSRKATFALIPILQLLIVHFSLSPSLPFTTWHTA
jgi:hypothetical protein